MSYYMFFSGYGVSYQVKECYSIEKSFLFGIETYLTSASTAERVGPAVQ